MWQSPDSRSKQGRSAVALVSIPVTAGLRGVELELRSMLLDLAVLTISSIHISISKN